MFAYFFNIFYYEFGYRLYELIQNSVLFYSILVTIFLLLNLLILTRKFKVSLKIFLNLIFALSFFVFFIFPYFKGEKIYKNINCTYDLVSEVKDYRRENGGLPSNLNILKVPQCASELNIKYEILSKGSIFHQELLKEDSFLITLRIPELEPLDLIFAGHKKEFYGVD